MHALDELAHTLLLRLAWSSLQAVLLIALLVLLIHLLPRLSAALRCTLWWLVGLQLIVGLVWHAPLQLALLSPPAIQQVVDNSAVHPTNVFTTRREQSATMSGSLSAARQPASISATQPSAVRWPPPATLYVHLHSERGWASDAPR